MSPIVMVPTEKLRLGAFGSGEPGRIFYDRDTASRFLQNRKSTTLLILTELNEVDVQKLKQSDPILVTIQTEWEIYDRESAIGESSPEYYKYKSQYREGPLFSKFFYMSSSDTVRDLNINVLRKLIPATDLFEPERQREEGSKFFERLWILLSDTLVGRNFFYIRLGQTLLTQQMADNRLDEICDVRAGRLEVSVFINIPLNTQTKVDFKEMMHYKDADKFRDPIICKSADFSEFKMESHASPKDHPDLQNPELPRAPSEKAQVSLQRSAADYLSRRRAGHGAFRDESKQHSKLRRHRGGDCLPARLGGL